MLDLCRYKGRSDNATTVQCLYKSDDGTPVPVALFATTRCVSWFVLNLARH